MPGTLTTILRYPIKSHGRETIEQVEVGAGGTLPWDRVWAVAHAASQADGTSWAPCVNFSRGSKAPGLGAITSQFEETTGQITLFHPNLAPLTCNPDTDGDKIVAWSAPLIPQERSPSARIVRAAGQAFTDSDFPSITLANHVSHRAVEQRVGSPLSLHRWRANIWIDGLAPWEEFDWIDREIRVGTAVLVPRERTDRCLATHNNPETGKRDIDVLTALDSWGHSDFTVRAEVVQAGRIACGDSVAPA